MTDRIAKRTWAVIPAGGQSVRMGRPKLSLPLGERTVIERVIDAFQLANVADVLVILAPHTADLVESVSRTGARPLVMSEATPDMRATVEFGLHWLDMSCQPDPDEAWFLSPADHPTLEPDLLRQLLSARQQNTTHSIFLPTQQGKRGHPALIAWQHVAGIRSLAANMGLNSYFREHLADTFELEVNSEEIFRDLDTPEDYQRLLQQWAEGAG